MNKDAKIKKYEEFLHALNYAVVAGNTARVEDLVDNAVRWSYAHRQGNGELTDAEQRGLVEQAFYKLTD